MLAGGPSTGGSSKDRTAGTGHWCFSCIATRILAPVEERDLGQCGACRNFNKRCRSGMFWQCCFIDCDHTSIAM